MPAPMIDDLEVGVGGDLVLAPRRRAAVFAADGQLLFEQREVRRHVGAAADRELHDLRAARRRRAERPGDSRRRGSG